MWSITKETVSKWIDVNAPRLSAALAYYTIFSLAPLLVVLVAIASLVYGRQAAQGQIAEQIQGAVGGQAAGVIQSLLQNAEQGGSGVLASVIGFAVLLFGASAVFGELRSSLNEVWGVAEAGPGGLFGWVKKRAFAFGVVLAVGFLLLVTLLASAFLNAAIRYSSNILPLPGETLQWLNVLFSFAMTVVLFALLYKAVPDAEIRWKEVWVGALATALLFTVGKFFIGLYLGRAAVGSSFGAAGSLVVLLAWLYYSSLIFFLGAVFTRVWAERHGRLLPEELPERRPRAA